MEFDSANPSVVRSIKQRELLNAWLRAFDRRRAPPAVTDYQPERIDDELLDMMGFDVISAASSARASRRSRLPSHSGQRLLSMYCAARFFIMALWVVAKLCMTWRRAPVNVPM